MSASTSPVGWPATERRERLLLGAVQLLLLLPFLDKAVHIDDGFFLAIARHIALDPLRPYDFFYNWTGQPDWVWQEMKNPPLVFYLQAFLVALGGEGERWLHACFGVFAVVATQATYSLARRVGARPLYPALLLAVCPAFWVSATSLMIDVPLVALLTLAVVALARAGDRDARWLYWASGAAAAASVLTKYFALVWLPLLALQAGWARGGPLRRVAVLAPPLVAFAIWTWASGGHILEAVGYRATERASGGRLLQHGVSTATFVGGLLVFPVVGWVAAWRHSRERGVALLALGLALGMLVLRLGWFPVAPQWANDALLVATCAGALAFAARAFPLARDLRLLARSGTASPEERLRLLLRLWFAGGLLFAVAINWTLNARTVLLVAVPATLVFAWTTEGRIWLRRAALGATAVVGFVVVLADMELAEFGREQALRARAEAGSRRLRFVGHWGFQYYMERAGFEHVDLSRPDVRPGDVVWIPQMHRVASMPLAALPPSRVGSDAQARMRSVPRVLPIAVMSRESGAGLHGAFLGHLPYAWATDPLERIEVRQW